MKTLLSLHPTIKTLGTLEENNFKKFKLGRFEKCSTGLSNEHFLKGMPHGRLPQKTPLVF